MYHKIQFDLISYRLTNEIKKYYSLFFSIQKIIENTMDVFYNRWNTINVYSCFPKLTLLTSFIKMIQVLKYIQYIYTENKKQSRISSSVLKFNKY